MKITNIAPENLVSKCSLVAMLLLVMAGCSTISFFPTADAQKAADKVIKDIWPAPEPVKTAKDPVAGATPSGANTGTGSAAK